MGPEWERTGREWDAASRELGNGGRPQVAPTRAEAGGPKRKKAQGQIAMCSRQSAEILAET